MTRLDEAAARVARYLDTLASMPHQHQEEIHSVGSRASNNETVTLLVSDLRALVTAAEANAWCNCQAIPGTPNYPGPWHPWGDPVGCFRYGRTGNCPRCGKRDIVPELSLCKPCDVAVEAEIAAESGDPSAVSS